MKRPVVLCILDGWGIAPPSATNAISQAHTPFLDSLTAAAPESALATHGPAVGLPQGQFGNSEVGHMVLGSGRIPRPSLSRIDDAVRAGEVNDWPIWKELTRQVNGRLHLVGMVSPGGVHSHVSHLIALIQSAHKRGVRDVRVHAILDGRDVLPASARDSLVAVEECLSELGYAPIASMAGRYFGMDRDKRWDRTQSYWKLLTRSRDNGRPASAIDVLHDAYAEGETDEFVTPRCCAGHVPMAEGDSAVLFNFRPDRMRQLTACFEGHEESGVQDLAQPKLQSVATMTKYSDEQLIPPLLETPMLEKTLGEVVSVAGLSQWRIAETEKYAHVTYLFSGGRELMFERERRRLVPSPRVTTYDKAPEMNAAGVAEAVAAALLEAEPPALIICNFANGDMVGHTGVVAAAVKACEAVDRGLSHIAKAAETLGAVMAITADHGNVEEMRSPEGETLTSHTTNLVPFLVSDPDITLRDQGTLADVAPTVLEFLGLDQPELMTGRSLIVSA